MGEGVKICQFWDDIVYGRPLDFFIVSSVIELNHMSSYTEYTLD